MCNFYDTIVGSIEFVYLVHVCKMILYIYKMLNFIMEKINLEDAGIDIKEVDYFLLVKSWL